VTGGAQIRAATLADEPALVAIDRATWSTVATPAPPPPAGTAFFAGRTEPPDVLVAVVDGAVAGYASIGPATGVPANDHVLMLHGLAVDPAWQGRGLARRLVVAAVEEARARGARRLRLRVLGHNPAALRVYEASGFVVEGVLREEFRIDGRYVDDVLMAADLSRPIPDDDQGAP
jgi:ribosomal protein S18 acetylase RimI-like enzyme